MSVAPLVSRSANKRRRSYEGEVEEEPRPEPRIQQSSPSQTRETPFAPSTPQTDHLAPLREARNDDKLRLQQLNKRLELLILYQREREAARGGLEKELESVKASHGREFEHLKAQLREATNLARNRAEAHANESAILHAEIANLKVQIEALEKKLAKEVKHREGVEGRLENMTKECHTTRNELISAEADLHTRSQELSDANAEIARLRDQLAKEKDRTESLNMKFINAQRRADAAGEELDAERKHKDDTIRRLSENLANLTQGAQSTEEKLRKEFGKQLADLLEARHAQADQEKAEMLAQYEQLISKLNGEIQKLTEKSKELEIEFANSRTESASKFHTLNKVAEALRAELQGAEEKLKTELRGAEVKYSTALETIERLKATLSKQNADYDNLIDVKIALTAEIKQYRTLLQNEDERLRKEDSQVLFLVGDSEGKILRIRNTSSESVKLRGWKLRSGKTNKELRLGPGDLAAGKILEVRTSPHAGEGPMLEFGPNVFLWGGLVWDRHDEALLVDPNGRVIARRDITPHT